MICGRHGKTRVGVLTIIQEEFDALKVALGADTWARRTRYWHASDGPERFVLAKMADRTNVAAFEATRDLIEHWRPDIVMLVGIAGGLAGGDAGLGDVVIPDYIHYGDFRKITEGADELRYAAYDQPTVSLRSDIVEGVREEGRWVDRVAIARPPFLAGDASGSNCAAPKVEVGGLVAGEKVLGDPDHPEQGRVFTSFENALAVDMESWGVGRAVHHARTDADYNPRLTVVRGISDIVERRRISRVAQASSPREAAETIPSQEPVQESEEHDDEARSVSDTVVVASENHAQRARWKPYAAATAAAFASAVVEEITNGS
jgi:nucleoside phosphorylase